MIGNIIDSSIRIAKANGFTNIKKGVDGFSCTNRGLVVIFSISIENDNKNWIHVSYSYHDRLPSYEITKEMKRIFIGDDKKAIMIFPEKSEHINIMPYCLHLWHCIDGDNIPDFRKLGMI